MRAPQEVKKRPVNAMDGDDAIHETTVNIDYYSFAGDGAVPALDDDHTVLTGGRGATPAQVNEVEPEPVEGTNGNDVIYETTGSFEYYGLDGDDVFYAHATGARWNNGWYYYPDDHFHGGAGNDTISYALSNKAITAHLGLGVVARFFNGEVQSTDYLDSIENVTGSSYGDQIIGNGLANTLRGGGGNDTIDGEGGNDYLYGDSGNDTLDGGDGHDRLEGGSGDDTIDGGDGMDTVAYTGAGAVEVNLWLGTASGAWGNDTLIDVENAETGSGDDIVYGSYGNNVLIAGAGHDVVYALAGDDVVFAGSGNDLVYGYEGGDVIWAGTGNDVVWAGSQGDTVYGEAGNDELHGEGGDDFLHGGEGTDRLHGGDGVDTLVGGQGADVFEWQAGDSGADMISDFNLAEDRLWFADGFFETDPVGAVDLSDVLVVVDVGPHAMLAANTAEQGWVYIATLLNVDANALQSMIANESILVDPIVAFGGGVPGDVAGMGLNDDPFADSGLVMMANYNYGML